MYFLGTQIKAIYWEMYWRKLYGRPQAQRLCIFYFSEEIYKKLNCKPQGQFPFIVNWL